jgi:hypothetical protein
MATLNRDAMIARVLQALGVVASGETAQAADSTLVGEVLDSAHDRLEKLGLAPFSLTNVPEWAQVPLRDYVALDCAPPFGIVGNALMEFAARRKEAETQLAQQACGRAKLQFVVARYF